jgi:hypothetical protein
VTPRVVAFDTPPPADLRDGEVVLGMVRGRLVMKLDPATKQPTTTPAEFVARVGFDGVP